MNASPRSVVAVTAACAAAATILVTFLPSLRFAYHAPSLRIALETAAALIALVAAYLVFGRYRRTASFDHLLLVVALVFLSLANVIVVVLVAADPGWLSGRIVALTSAVGAVALAVAAFVPRPASFAAPGARRSSRDWERAPSSPSAWSSP